MPGNYPGRSSGRSGSSNGGPARQAGPAPGGPAPARAFVPPAGGVAALYAARNSLPLSAAGKRMLSRGLPWLALGFAAYELYQLWVNMKSPVGAPYGYSCGAANFGPFINAPSTETCGVAVSFTSGGWTIRTSNLPRVAFVAANSFGAGNPPASTNYYVAEYTSNNPVAPATGNMSKVQVWPTTTRPGFEAFPFPQSPNSPLRWPTLWPDMVPPGIVVPTPALMPEPLVKELRSSPAPQGLKMLPPRVTTGRFWSFELQPNVRPLPGAPPPLRPAPFPPFLPPLPPQIFPAFDPRRPNPLEDFDWPKKHRDPLDFNNPTNIEWPQFIEGEANNFVWHPEWDDPTEFWECYDSRGRRTAECTPQPSTARPGQNRPRFRRNARLGDRLRDWWRQRRMEQAQERTNARDITADGQLGRFKPNIQWEVEMGPNLETKMQRVSNTPHELVPQDREKKIKTNVQGAFYIAFNALSEARDFVNVLYRAIPVNKRPRAYNDFQRFMAVSDNLRHVNPNLVIIGLIQNEIGDRSAALAAKRGREAQQAVFDRYGIGHGPTFHTRTSRILRGP